MVRRHRFCLRLDAISNSPLRQAPNVSDLWVEGMGTCRVTVRAGHAGLLVPMCDGAAGTGTAVLQLGSGRRVLMACNMQTVFKTSGHVKCQ